MKSGWLDREIYYEWNKKKEDDDLQVLLLELVSTWQETVKQLNKIYYTKFHQLYLGKTIHDGNRAWGNVEFYINLYKNNEKLDASRMQALWLACQNLINYMRQADILIELWEILNENTEKGKS